MLHRDLRGKDLHAPSNELLENNSGITLTPFKVVALSGMGAVYPQVVQANSNIHQAFGIVQPNPELQVPGGGIPTGKSGYVTCIGFMFNLDTSAWPAGIPLYFDTNGNLTNTVPPLTNPTPIAIVVRSSAQFGVIYVTAVADQFADSSGDWNITGNSGLDPDLNFIGTIDAIPFRIKTNSIQREVITPDGRFGFGTTNAPLEFWHKKAHSGYQNSGRLETTSSVTTFAITPSSLWQFTVPDNTVAVIEVSADAINTVQGRSAALKRTAAFARIGGILSQVGLTQSDYTFRSTPGMTLNFTVDQINSIVRAVVVSDTAIETAWVGHIAVDLSQRNS